MDENTTLDLPDNWVTNANTETHFSFVNTKTNHVLVITPSKSVTSSWRVKGLQEFETEETEYPVFATDVDEDEAMKTAAKIMETITSNGEIGGINTINPESEPETNGLAETKQPDEVSNSDKSETSSDDDEQADLSSFI